MTQMNQSGSMQQPTAVLPYASPYSAGQGGGVWRDGKRVIMHKQAQLPGVCFKCGGPASTLLKRNLSWHEPWLFILILFPGLLIYIIVALIIRKTAKIHVPLCQAHAARRTKFIWIGWLTALAGIGSFILAGVLSDDRQLDDYVPLAILAGFVLFFGGAITGLVGSQVATPARIDDQYVHLKGAGEPVLQMLPPAR